MKLSRRSFVGGAIAAPFLAKPGFGQATYLYAHAREGMFLPLLRT